MISIVANILLLALEICSTKDGRLFREVNFNDKAGALKLCSAYKCEVHDRKINWITTRRIMNGLFPRKTCCDRSKRTQQDLNRLNSNFSSTKSVECSALSLERVHDIHRGHCLALGVLKKILISPEIDKGYTYFSISHCVAHNVLQEHFQHATCLFVDHATDSLHSSTTRKSSNRWFSNTSDWFAD